MANHKPGFIYKFSKELNQEIAVSDKTGILYVSDGTKYLPEEAAVLQKKSDDIPLEVHILKKVFDGMIVEESK